MRNTRFTEDTENNVYYAEYAGKCYSIKKDKYKALTMLLGEEDLDLRYVVNTLSSIGTYDECIKVEPLEELTKEPEVIPDLDTSWNFDDELEEIPVMEKPSSFDGVLYAMPKIDENYDETKLYCGYNSTIEMAKKYVEKLFNDKDTLRRQRAYMFLSRVYNRKYNLDLTDYILYAKDYKHEVVFRYKDNLIDVIEKRRRSCLHSINTIEDKLKDISDGDYYGKEYYKDKIIFTQEHLNEIEIGLSVIRDTEEPPILSPYAIHREYKQSVQDYLQRGIDMICEMYNKPSTFEGFMEALTLMDREFINKDCNLYGYLIRENDVQLDTDLEKAVALLIDKQGSSIFLADKDFRSCLSDKLALAYTSNILRAIPCICSYIDNMANRWERFNSRFINMLVNLKRKDEHISSIIELSKDRNISLNKVYSKEIIEGIENSIESLDNIIGNIQDSEYLPHVLHFRDTVVKLLKHLKDSDNDTSDWI